MTWRFAPDTSDQRQAGTREDTEADAQAQRAEQHTGTGMITRGRKRTEEESSLSQKRLREKAKRAKDIGKRARGAKSREPARQGDATGVVVVTQTKKGEELTSRKSLKRNSSDNQEKPRSTADDIAILR